MLLEDEHPPQSPSITSFATLSWKTLVFFLFGMTELVAGHANGSLSLGCLSLLVGFHPDASLRTSALWFGLWNGLAAVVSRVVPMTVPGTFSNPTWHVVFCVLFGLVWWVSRRQEQRRNDNRPSVIESMHRHWIGASVDDDDYDDHPDSHHQETKNYDQDGDRESKKNQ